MAKENVTEELMPEKQEVISTLKGTASVSIDISEEQAKVVQESSKNPQATLQEAQDLFASGTQALALLNYEQAAEQLALAVEIQVVHYGEYAIEAAPTFHLYGKALLAAAIQKNGVLGEKADQVKPIDTSLNQAAADASGENFVFEGDEEDEEDLENDEGKVLDDIEIPLADDLELAWENLDVARVILSRQSGVDYVLQLAEVYLSLGDVSLESENFDQAIKDYQTALDLKIGNSPESWRELAEAHFKLGLAFEYSEQNEEAIEQIASAMTALKKRVDFLELQTVGKGKAVADGPSDTRTREIEELKGFLFEMTSKLTDLKSVLDKEDLGELIANPIAKGPVNDISKLVKRRKLE